MLQIINIFSPLFDVRFFLCFVSSLPLQESISDHELLCDFPSSRCTLPDLKVCNRLTDIPCIHINIYIQYVTITVSIPRTNSQAKRLNRVIISVLTKLSIRNPTWFLHVGDLQQITNSTIQRSTLFDLMFGIIMQH